jgi:hypothetical protein
LFLSEWVDSQGKPFSPFSAERAFIVWIEWLESELKRRVVESVEYEYDSSVDMSGGLALGGRKFPYKPLEKRMVKQKFRVFKPHCPYTAKVCSDLTIYCHSCSAFIKAFSYAFLYSDGRLKG